MLFKMSLEEIYLDYVNNFLTIEDMADYYGVDYEFMSNLYELTYICMLNI